MPKKSPNILAIFERIFLPIILKIAQSSHTDNLLQNYVHSIPCLNFHNCDLDLNVTEENFEEFFSNLNVTKFWKRWWLHKTFGLAEDYLSTEA